MTSTVTVKRANQYRGKYHLRHSGLTTIVFSESIRNCQAACAPANDNIVIFRMQLRRVMVNNRMWSETGSGRAMGCFQDGQEGRDLSDLDQHGVETKMTFDSSIKGEVQSVYQGETEAVTREPVNSGSRRKSSIFQLGSKVAGDMVSCKKLQKQYRLHHLHADVVTPTHARDADKFETDDHRSEAQEGPCAYMQGPATIAVSRLQNTW